MSSSFKVIPANDQKDVVVVEKFPAWKGHHAPGSEFRATTSGGPHSTRTFRPLQSSAHKNCMRQRPPKRRRIPRNCRTAKVLIRKSCSPLIRNDFSRRTSKSIVQRITFHGTPFINAFDNTGLYSWKYTGKKHESCTQRQPNFFCKSTPLTGKIRVTNPECQGLTALIKNRYF